MLWLYTIIIILTLFCLYLAFKLYFTATNVHEIVYSLLFQIILLRDMVMMYDTDTITYEQLTTLKLQSFWPQGHVGNFLIQRHHILISYIQQSTNNVSNPSIISAKHNLINKLKVLDGHIIKYVSFNMHTVSGYTINMIDNIIKKKQIDSLLSVKGLIYALQ